MLCPLHTLSATTHRTIHPTSRLGTALATNHAATEHLVVMMTHQALTTGLCPLMHLAADLSLLALRLALAFSFALAPHGKGVLVGLGDVGASFAATFGA